MVNTEPQVGIRRFFKRRNADLGLNPAIFFQPHNTSLDISAINAAIRAAHHPSGKNLFEIAKVEPNEKNILALLGNFYRVELGSSMPAALDPKLQPTYEDMRRFDVFTIGFMEHFLFMLFNGIKEKEKPTYHDPNSLSRHLERTAALARVLTVACLKGQEIAKDSSQTKLIDFGFKHFGGLHPFLIGVPAHLHDAVRHVRHSMDHDKLLADLAADIGVVPAIANSFHEPVLIDSDINSKFDSSGAQRILRLADNFGKVIVKEEPYQIQFRTTVEEASKHSRNRQETYFASEVNKPGSFWFGKTRDHLEKYLANERIMYESAVNWFEEVSKTPFTQLMQHINARPAKFDIYEYKE